LFPLAVTKITSKENGRPENNDSRSTRSSCSSWQELALTISHNVELCETLCQNFGSHVRCIAAHWFHVLSGIWSRNEELNIYWTTNTTSATISRTGSKMTPAEKFLTGLSVGGVGLARWHWEWDWAALCCVLECLWKYTGHIAPGLPRTKFGRYEWRI